jgi:hypothetical protein
VQDVRLCLFASSGDDGGDDDARGDDNADDKQDDEHDNDEEDADLTFPTVMMLTMKLMII